MRILWWPCVGAVLLAGCAPHEVADNITENRAVPANATAAPLVPILHRDDAVAPATVKRVSAPATTPAPGKRHDMERPPIAYRALGTEPFWAVTVRGDRATLERPDRPPLTVVVRLSEGPHAIRYVGNGLTLLATAGPCSDGMNDALYADRVQLAFAEGTLNGCGGPRVDDEGR